MNRGHWKDFSSYEPEEKSRRRRGVTNDSSDDEPPPEVQVKKGYSWSDELGIAIAALVEDGQRNLIDWTKEVKYHHRSWHDLTSDCCWRVDSNARYWYPSEDRRGNRRER